MLNNENPLVRQVRKLADESYTEQRDRALKHERSAVVRGELA